MTSKELNHLLATSGNLKARHTEFLGNTVEKYPYFQAARAVYLKGLYTQDSFDYNYELKKTAAYTTDRSVLFDFITSREFTQDKVALQIKEQENNLRNITVFEAQEVFGSRIIPLNEAIKMKKTESDQVLDPGLFERPNTSSSKKPDKANHPPVSDLTTGKPLEFNNHESHSFSEWLRLTSAKPIERENSKIDETRDRKFELINDFISKSPKLNKPIAGATGNIAQDRSVPPEALMTETLARVYLEQKNYKKAMQAYKILILKNPEKSGFFADQIRAIKNLQENNTGKE